MFNIFADMSTGVAIVSAFMSGVAVVVFGGAAFYHIKAVIKDVRSPKGQMAVRNK